MMGRKKDKIIEKRFGSLLQNYQKDLDETMRGSEFIFDSVDLFYCHLQKMGLERR